MSYATVRAGLIARYATISGIKSNLDYLPTSVAAPGVYTVLDHTDYPVTAGLKVEMHHFQTYLLVSWQNNEAAEDVLVTWIADVKAALNLGSYLVDGAFVTALTVSPLFVTISGTTYRAALFEYTVKETNG